MDGGLMTPVVRTAWFDFHPTPTEAVAGVEGLGLVPEGFFVETVTIVGPAATWRRIGDGDAETYPTWVCHYGLARALPEES